MTVYLVWMDDAYDSRELYGCFSDEGKAQEWINTNLDSRDASHIYIEEWHLD